MTTRLRMTKSDVNFAEQSSEHESSRTETSSISYGPLEGVGVEKTTEEQNIDRDVFLERNVVKVDASKKELLEDVENESINEVLDCGMRLIRGSDVMESEILIGKPVTSEISEVIEEDVATDYDVEMILANQNTHDLFCPNCHSCITRRVVLQRRKRKVRFKQRKNKQLTSETFNAPISVISSSDGVSAKENYHDDNANLFRCLSCFNFFIPSGTVFECFGDSKLKQANKSEQESIDSSNWFFSIFSDNWRKTRKISDAQPELPSIDETIEPEEIREASLSKKSFTSATTNSDSPNVTCFDEDKYLSSSNEIQESRKSGNDFSEIEQAGTKQPIQASLASAVFNEKDDPPMTSKPSRSSSKRQDGSFFSGIGNGILKIKDSIRGISTFDKGSILDSSDAQVSSHNDATKEEKPISLDAGRRKPINESEFEDSFSPQSRNMREDALVINGAISVLSTSGTEKAVDFSNQSVSYSKYVKKEAEQNAFLDGDWNMETAKESYEGKNKTSIPKLQDIPFSNEIRKETSKIDDAMQGLSTTGREKVMDFFNVLVSSSKYVTNEEEQPLLDDERKKPKVRNSLWNKSKILLSAQQDTPFSSGTRKGPIKIEDVVQFLLKSGKKTAIESSSLRSSSADYGPDVDEQINLPDGRRGKSIDEQISVSSRQDNSPASGIIKNSSNMNDENKIPSTYASAFGISKVTKEDEQTILLFKEGQRQITASSFEEKGKSLPSAVVKEKRNHASGNEAERNSSSLEVSSNYDTHEVEQGFLLDGEKKRPMNQEYVPIVRDTSKDATQILSTSGSEKTFDFSDSQLSSFRYVTTEHEQKFSVVESQRKPMIESFLDGESILSQTEEAPYGDELAIDFSSLFTSSPKDITNKDESKFSLDGRKEKPVLDSLFEINSTTPFFPHRNNPVSSEMSKDSAVPTSRSENSVSFSNFQVSYGKEVKILMTDFRDNGEEEGVDFSYSQASSPKYSSKVEVNLNLHDELRTESEISKSKQGDIPINPKSDISKVIETSNGDLQVILDSGNETDVGSSDLSVSSPKYVTNLSAQPVLVNGNSEKPLATQPDISFSNEMLVSISDTNQVLSAWENEKTNIRVSSGANITTKDEHVVFLDEEGMKKPIIKRSDDEGKLSLHMNQDILLPREILEGNSKITDPKLSPSGSKKVIDFSSIQASSSNFVAKEDEQTALLTRVGQKPVIENAYEDFGTQHYMNFVNEILRGSLKIEDVIKILSSPIDSSNVQDSSANKMIDEDATSVNKLMTQSTSDSKETLKSPTSKLLGNSDEIQPYDFARNRSIPKSYQSRVQDYPSAANNQNSESLVIDVESASTKAKRTPKTEISTEASLITCIVYGGLVESITSLGVVSSAAGAGASTASTFGLGLANVIGGFFVLCHTILDLKHDRTTEDSEEESSHNRYMVLKALRKNFVLYATVIAVSYAASGALPPIVFGFSFYKSDDRDFKYLTVAAASVVCVGLLAAGKTYANGKSNYFQNIMYFVAAAFGASGSSFVVGDLFVRCLHNFGWPQSNPVPRQPGWSSF